MGPERLLMGLVLALVLLAPGIAVSAAAPQPIRLAVAHFEGERADMPVAEALAGRLARRSIERLIAPDAFVAEARFEPPAAEVRRWAYNAAVEVVVVGRLSTRHGGAGEPMLRVEAALRSGHSGAELARHEAVLARPAELGAAVERLAEAILTDLGYVEAASPAPVVAPAAGSGGSSAVSGASGTSAAGAGGAASRGSDSASSSGARGLETDLDLGSQRDHPIEIKADEAEIIDRGESRELVFKRNVWVRQGNVTLQSDVLQALYVKGESDPRELVARGRVRVAQGDRRARCDEATYLREAELLRCRGHAELVQGCDIVRGESIEFDLAGDRARVQGAASIVIQPKDASPASCGSSGDAT